MLDNLLCINLLYIILDINIVSALYFNSNSYNLFKFQESNMRPFYASKHFCSNEYVNLFTSNNITNSDNSKIYNISILDNTTDIANNTNAFIYKKNNSLMLRLSKY